METNIPVLILDGAPVERGRAHGKALRTVIHHGVNGWKQFLQKSSGIEAKPYIQNFLEDTRLLSAVERWAPELLEEVKGIGEGANVDFDTIFAWQCYDEECWYRIFEREPGTHSLLADHCSAMGCLEEGQPHVLLAQNMDLPNEYDGLQTLLKVKHATTSLQSYVFTYAGGVGLCGLNNQPVGICANSLFELRHSPDGLPVAFIIRKVLECSTSDEAREFIHSIKHASGQNYLIADSKRVLDFECSANKVMQFVPDDGARRVYHTNHAMVNDDRVASTKEINNLQSSSHFNLRDSQERYAFLQENLSDTSKSVGVRGVQSILGCHKPPICRHNTHKPKGACTLASLIMTLSNSSELYLAVQPPCTREPQTFSF